MDKITDANVGQFLTERHPGFTAQYEAHLADFGTDSSARYFLLRRFSEYMIPLLGSGPADERAALFGTVEQLLTNGDELIQDAVDHDVIAELVFYCYVQRESPAPDLTGAGPETTARIVRTRDWRPPSKP